MQYKGLLYYLLIWLVPIISAVILSIIKSVGLAVVAVASSLVLTAYLYFYIKSIKIKIKKELIIVNKGRIIKQRLNISKSNIVCVKTLEIKLIKIYALLIILAGYKILIPFINKEKLQKVREWYGECST